MFFILVQYFTQLGMKGQRSNFREIGLFFSNLKSISKKVLTVSKDLHHRVPRSILNRMTDCFDILIEFCDVHIAVRKGATSPSNAESLEVKLSQKPLLVAER